MSHLKSNWHFGWFGIKFELIKGNGEGKSYNKWLNYKIFELWSTIKLYTPENNLSLDTKQNFIWNIFTCVQPLSTPFTALFCYKTFK